jgi:hypothetical protein
MDANFLAPFCQSCAMPPKTIRGFRDGYGYRINDYCSRCYRDGSFTQPDIMMHEMIETCAGIMADYGVMQREQARALMIQVAPDLKRWRQG